MGNSLLRGSSKSSNNSSNNSSQNQSKKLGDLYKSLASQEKSINQEGNECPICFLVIYIQFILIKKMYPYNNILFDYLGLC